MKKERRAITVRVDPQLKFAFEKQAAEENYPTLNSWIIAVLKGYIEKK